MAKINILALGGLDEKQRRLYILDIDSKIFIFDSGVYEPLNNDFGIQHFVPNLDYLKHNLDKIKGIFLSSANRMNIGSLLQVVNLKKDIEIYGSQSTLDSLDVFFGEKSKDWNKKTIVKNKTIEVGGIEVTGINLASSIPGTLGFSLKTNDGNILYLTDYIFDSIKEYNLSAIYELSSFVNQNNLLLISDSSLSTEKTALSSKFRIYDLVKKYMNIEKRFVITIYEDEIINAIELINLAKESKRKIYFKSNSLFSLIKIMMKNGDIEDYPIRKYEGADSYETNSIVVLSGTRTKLYKSVELLIESHNKNDFAFETEDIVYFSALPQAGNEHVFADVTNKISRIDPTVVKPSTDDKKIFGTTEFDIRNVIEFLKPKYFMPVSAYHTQLIAAKEIAVQNGIDSKNVIIADNGEINQINKGINEGIQQRVKEIESKVVESIGDDSISNELIEERKSIGKDGVITISLIYDVSKFVVSSDIDIQMKGVVISKGQEEVLEKIKELIIVTSDELSETKQHLKKGVPSLRKAMSKIFRENFKKVPSLIITIVDI